MDNNKVPVKPPAPTPSRKPADIVKKGIQQKAVINSKPVAKQQFIRKTGKG